MNKTTHPNTVYPQTVEIPAPLEVHPSISPLAAELLMKTAHAIAREPASYAQESAAGCGTCGSPCCIIGHMKAISKTSGYSRDDSVLAQLGLLAKQRDSLYHLAAWPASFPRSYEGITASFGIARIEHFLRTGK